MWTKYLALLLEKNKKLAVEKFIDIFLVVNFIKSTKTLRQLYTLEKTLALILLVLM